MGEKGTEKLSGSIYSPKIFSDFQNRLLLLFLFSVYIREH